MRTHGTDVNGTEADLASTAGVDRLLEAAQGRTIDVLCANAGRGLGRAFLDQNVADWRRVVDTNIVGTTYLLQRVLRQMVDRGAGKVLVTGSIAGLMPGSFQAVYNATKAYIDNFTDGLRNEIKHSKGVTLTTLMPGPTDTEFFERADMLDTKVGTQNKNDPAKVAKDGWEALLTGKSHIVSGWKNKAQAAVSHLTPTATLAEMHRNMAEPATAKPDG